MGRGSKKARAEARELAQALGRPETGLAAYYSQKRDARDAERSAKAARSIAERECNYAFGARCEGQFLALARAIAKILAEREAKESDPEFMREDALLESAKGFGAAQLAQTRAHRANGLGVRWSDYGSEIEHQTAGFADLPPPGAWVRCPWETGRFDLEGLSIPWDWGLSVAHAAGDLKQKNFNRAREIRFYHPLGDELDPEGDCYFRLIGHIPANLPPAAIRRTVRLLVEKWGENPADWMGDKLDPETQKPLLHSDGSRVLVPLFDRLARKLKNNTNKGPA